MERDAATSIDDPADAGVRELEVVLAKLRAALGAVAPVTVGVARPLAAPGQ